MVPTISEACGLWIEQRVQEEFNARGDTGASLRSIGRTVAAEVEKYFETKVNPETIKSRAIRQLKKVGSNEPQQKSPTNPATKPEIKKIKQRQAS